MLSIRVHARRARGPVGGVVHERARHRARMRDVKSAIVVATPEPTLSGPSLSRSIARTVASITSST